MSGIDVSIVPRAALGVSVSGCPGISVSVSAPASGTLDYNALHNKPHINNVELVGDRQLPEDKITNSELLEIWSRI